ncbi:MAG: hypothetical protein B6242_00550 [Anaerolineaceae bacterium 4572_78]|nr:MAG: hypothetical protein B6242_00550 [Anaerolineaceae bacterium 4572_78]
MKIAFFTLLSPIQSALSDCAEGLALAMANIPEVIIDLFINDDYQPDTPAILEQFNIYTYHEFASRADLYDICLYWVGDHGDYHGFMFDFIHRYPGVLVLNDTTLHRAVMTTTLYRGNEQSYLDEMKYAYNINDLRVAKQIEAGDGDYIILKYPLFERMVNSSLGVVLHNNYARLQVLMRCPNAKVKRIFYPFFIPPATTEFDLHEKRKEKRAELGLENYFVVGAFGIFVPNKHLEDCLNAFANVVKIYPQSKFILGGFAIPEYDLAGYIQEIGLTEHVIITGWLPPKAFSEMMFALDVGIHLRYPHIGGTPYTPIRLMGVNACTIVSDIEPLAEVPQGACIKIIPDMYQFDTLNAILTHLVNNRNFCRQVADNGQQFIEKYHHLHHVAQQ